jgi:SAM-dependent methyltransferase
MNATILENAAGYNEALYEALWRRMPFHPPERLPWWPAIKALADDAPNRLEIGPGVFPRMPVAGTHVVDLSAEALSVLARRGAIAHHGLLHDLGFSRDTFDLVGMFEVLEHVPDDEGLLRELARITRPGGHLVLTVPMGMQHYCSFDRYMGHVRRYEPEELRSKLERAGFALECFEVHDQSVREPAARVYVWFFRHAPRIVAWALRHVFLPLLERKRIVWHPPAEWAARTAGATDCGAIVRRVGPRI